MNQKEEPNYNDGQWHGWNNQPQPSGIHPESLLLALWVDEENFNHSKCFLGTIDDIAWNDDFDGTQSIKAFKVIKPYTEGE